MSDDEKKIIIDEDWKAQVEREKREAREKSTPEDAGDEKPVEEEIEDNPFIALMSSLVTQGLFALGLLATQESEEVYINMDQAKFIIDSLTALRDKTKGNLTNEEEGHLDEALAELQRIFVLRSQQMQDAAMQDTGIDPNQLKT